MADSKVLSLAKSLVVLETNDDSTLNIILEQCETPALLILKNYLSIADLSNYINSESLTYTSAELGSIDGYTKLNINYSKALKNGDMITIPTTELTPKVYAGTFVVENINYSENYIEIRKQFTVTESGTITVINDNILYAHAYLMVYLLAKNSQSIVKNDVIFSSQQFGQGSLAPASQSEKKFLCDRYFQQAMDFINTFEIIVV